MPYMLDREGLTRGFGRSTRRFVGFASIWIGASSCGDAVDGDSMRVDRLKPGTAGLAACEGTISLLDAWTTFSFANGEFELSLPPGAVRSDSGVREEWRTPEGIVIGVEVETVSTEEAAARAAERSERGTLAHACVARGELGAFVAHVWQGDWHPAGHHAWAVATWRLADEREIALTIQAPLGTDLAVHRAILGSIRRASGT